MRYEDKHVNVIPNEILRTLLGFTNCQMNGIHNNNIKYDVEPLSWLISVNQ